MKLFSTIYGAKKAGKHERAVYTRVTRAFHNSSEHQVSRLRGTVGAWGKYTLRSCYRQSQSRSAGCAPRINTQT
jgi:hypothetical protein